jgi:UDP-3-O-[3-hydroxymyristoyl] N-acetylglucosamine deacetylase
MQRTIKKQLTFTGIGLHTGSPISVTIRPADSGVGIQFIRSDICRNRLIAARPSSVLDTKLATRLGPDEACSISTTEHFLAALFGFGVDNLIIEVNGPELPIFDGSAAPFLALLDEAGVLDIEGSSRKLAVIQKAIEVVDPKDPSRFVRIEPARKPEIHYAIDFGTDNIIGRQSAHLPLNGYDFCRNFSYARTFCFADEVEMMRKHGLARGGSIENAVVVSRNQSTTGLLNQHGLRDPQEFVRHKILDCVGDLALVGHAVVGRVIAHKAGHDLHTQLAAQIVNAFGSGAVELVDSAHQKLNLESLIRFPKALDEVSFGTPALVVG